MRFIGHTMALPGMPIAEAARAFGDMGLDGVEVVCQEGTPFHTGVSRQEAQAIAETAREAGAPITTVTPYTWDLAAPDRGLREAARRELYAAMDLAEAMGARFVRVLAGREDVVGMEGAAREDAVARLARVLQVAAMQAVTRRVTLLVENHMGTLARTGAQTAALLEQVTFPGVRALFDPANIMWDTDESWQRALAAQNGLIAYVHVKDYAVRDGQRIACPVGEGVAPWETILPTLEYMGVGYASLEYEARWHPDQLPPAEVGVPQSLAFCRAALSVGI